MGQRTALSIGPLHRTASLKGSIHNGVNDLRSPRSRSSGREKRRGTPASTTKSRAGTQLLHTREDQYKYPQECDSSHVPGARAYFITMRSANREHHVFHETVGTNHLRNDPGGLPKPDEAGKAVYDGYREAGVEVTNTEQRHWLFVSALIIAAVLSICAMCTLTVAVCYVLRTAVSGSVPWVSVAFASTLLMQRASGHRSSSSTEQSDPSQDPSYEELEITEWQREVELYGRSYDSSPLFEQQK